jgi:hypothetical protein
MSGTLECKRARLTIGGEPQILPADVVQHVATCAACAKFRDETLAMEGRLKAALELPLHHFREPAKTSQAPTRRFALAASLLLAVLVGGGAWLFRPQPALAQEVVEHLRHEPGSWEQHRPLTAEELSAVLAKAGVRYDPRMPVVYASPCPFRGHIVPHLVVQTDHGLVTVMLLAHEKVAQREKFSEGEYQGWLMPAGEGSVALVARGQPVHDFDIKMLLTGVN